jgi:cysteinyl-tRNA synthetase
MKIFNTLTGKKEEFKPLKQGEAGMYACGVTVYDLCHIGHARSLIVFDIIYRYLSFKGYKVTFVRNFTDIDDKIIKRANEKGVDFKEISEKYIKEFHVDTEKLNIKKPQIEPKATDHIPDMIEFIKVLINKGFAYEKDGDVFYHVSKFSEYGKLSKKKTEDLISGARIDVDERKLNPLDFVLWKKSKPGEPFWESPWGKGRPGWHIECSVMSMKYLGTTFDIHGGGKDLIFPHHENEIAQSEAFSGRTFANYWIHNGFVNINKNKMSKSLGNFFTIREILEKVSPDVLRFFLLTSHYHKPIDFSFENINNAKSGFLKLNYTLDRLYAILVKNPVNVERKCDLKKLSKSQKKLYNKFMQFKDNFFSAMDDDFNTAAATGFVFDFITDLNKLIYAPSLSLSEDILLFLHEIKEFFTDFSTITGLFTLAPGEFIRREKEKFLNEKGIDEEFISGRIEKRNLFREKKEWDKADEIREELKKNGIILEDTPNSTEWRIDV